MAFRKDSRVSRVCGLRASPAAIIDTAVEPVCSAMRSRAEDTAGAEAPFNDGIMPSAARIHAIVLAVPITPQVPALNTHLLELIGIKEQIDWKM